MPRTVSFTLPGEPVAWQRRVVNKRGQQYTPAKTRDYAAYVRHTYALEAGTCKVHDGPVSLTLKARLKPPESWPKWRYEAWERGGFAAIACGKKPDLSNVLKLIEDALNRVAYHDDAQIVAENIQKVWSYDPGVTVTLTFWDAPTRENATG